MIDRTRVFRVYVEVNPVCSGRSYYSRNHKEYGGERRHFPIADSEIDDGRISKVVSIMNSNEPKMGENMYYTYINCNLFAAYLIP